jgi:hypothetical protein
MHTLDPHPDDQLRYALRIELLGLARREDKIAASEAALVHYWEPMPLSVGSHRHCASVLRGLADHVGAAAPSQERRWIAAPSA